MFSRILLLFFLSFVISCDIYISRSSINHTMDSPEITETTDCLREVCEPYFLSIDLRIPANIPNTVNVSADLRLPHNIYLRGNSIAVNQENWPYERIANITVGGHRVTMALNPSRIQGYYRSSLLLPNQMRVYPENWFNDFYNWKIYETSFSAGKLYWITRYNQPPVLGLALKISNFHSVAQELLNRADYNQLMRSSRIERGYELQVFSFRSPPSVSGIYYKKRNNPRIIEGGILLFVELRGYPSSLPLISP
ncbi:MAG: hypothetical protein OXB84_00315 [Halobacteriovoraceae bacterium]|nr:hypothetical protein [Halobacteriovoraceae bacterium]